MFKFVRFYIFIMIVLAAPAILIFKPFKVECVYNFRVRTLEM